MKNGSSLGWGKFGKKSRVAMAALVLASGLVATACGSGGGNSAGGNGTSSQASGKPIKIGISVSLSGDFSGDGKAIQDGYKVWANEVNQNGGLLGRSVQLIFLNDASSPSQVVTNYQTLINVDHVDLVFGPFSSLLTRPAATIANRYGYAFPEPAGGAPSVFAAKLPNIAFVQPTPLADNLQSFVNWILSLPDSQRPKTAAYATSDDPFTQPQLENAKAALQKAGVKTVYFKVYPAEATDFSPIAAGIINSKAQAVLLGTQQADAIAFIKQFEQQHFNPQVLVETAGPDTGEQFANAVGVNNTEGIMVPGAWFDGANTYGNQKFIQDYTKAYGGTGADISASAAEAYAVGQVVEQAVNQIKSIDNKKVTDALHTLKFNTVEGPMQFDSLGEPNGQSFLEQWQNGKPVPVYPKQFATVNPEFPKPNWQS